MTTLSKLSPKQLEAMEAVKGGADVYSYATAKALRSVERAFPGLVTIVEAMLAPKDGAKQQPYFGAILTKKGQLRITKRREHNRMNNACEHKVFDALVNVARLDSGAFVAEVQVRCVACDNHFVFLGLPVGVHPDRPTMSFDGTEARLPIAAKMTVGEMQAMDWSEREPSQALGDLAIHEGLEGQEHG